MAGPTLFESKRIRVAYADPPYLGMAARFANPGGVYDTVDGHRALIAQLTAEFPDGWALSLHTVSLRTILPLCPESCRVAAWVKPFASWKGGVNPAYCWEPVIWCGGRRNADRPKAKCRDYLAASCSLKTGFFGAKPEPFAFWLFDLLGLTPADELVDLFPGSGAVTRAWEKWRRLQDGLFAQRTEEAEG